LRFHEGTQIAESLKQKHAQPLLKKTDEYKKDGNEKSSLHVPGGALKETRGRYCKLRRKINSEWRIKCIGVHTDTKEADKKKGKREESREEKKKGKRKRERERGVRKRKKEKRRKREKRRGEGRNGREERRRRDRGGRKSQVGKSKCPPSSFAGAHASQRCDLTKKPAEPSTSSGNPVLRVFLPFSPEPSE